MAVERDVERFFCESHSSRNQWSKHINNLVEQGSVAKAMSATRDFWIESNLT